MCNNKDLQINKYNSNGDNNFSSRDRQFIMRIIGFIFTFSKRITLLYVRAAARTGFRNRIFAGANVSSTNEF